MLTFLRKIRKSLIESVSARKPASPAGRYLLYAIGEIALVVIGILIALQINNWNIRQNLNRQESSILHEIKRNINLNITEMASDSISIHNVIESLDIISNALLTDLPYNDTLSMHFSRINRFRYFNPVNTGYQLLKDKAAEVIIKDELIYDLINYFEESLVDLELNLKIIQGHYYEYILDYYRVHFIIDPSETLNSAKNQHPRNFEELKQNDEFITSINLYKIAHFSISILIENTLKDSRNILTKLEDYLDSVNE